jgi:superoxide reductase
MKDMAELYQSADWQTEKHVPFIDSPDSLKAGGTINLRVVVGKKAAHPNTTEHHIRWIAVYFLADGDKFPYELGRCEFNAHGESAEGPNKGVAFTNPDLTFSFKTSKSGVLIAASFCNVHGLWQSTRVLSIY